jgi:hypothetical protein
MKVEGEKVGKILRYFKNIKFIQKKQQRQNGA